MSGLYDDDLRGCVLQIAYTKRVDGGWFGGLVPLEVNVL